MTDHEIHVAAADIALTCQAPRVEGLPPRRVTTEVDRRSRRANWTLMEAAYIEALAQALAPLEPGVRVVADHWRINGGVPTAPMTVEGIDPDGMVVCRQDPLPGNPAPSPDGCHRIRYHAVELRLADEAPHATA